MTPEIAPQPLIAGVPGAMTEPFESLRIEHPRWGRLDLEMRGDQFELEDQRNWGDDSFKTYCTPLSRGFPRTVEQGHCISQRITVRFSPEPGLRERPAPVATWADQVPVRIGRVAATAEEVIADPTWMLGWDHIHLDLDEAAEGALYEVVSRLPPATTLHLVVIVDEDSAALSFKSELLNVWANRTSAILLKSRTGGLPTSAAVAQFRAALKDTVAERVPVLVIPNGHFVEFNRGVPFDLGVDGVAFPVSPAVHSEDAATILDNAPAVRAMVETARQLTGKSWVSISPLALFLPSLGRRSTVSRSVVAAWRAQVLVHCQAAGVHAVTLNADLL